MVNLSLYAAPAGGGLSVRNPQKLSSYNSAINTSILFPRTKNAPLFATRRGNHSKSISFNVKSQYLKPQEPQQKFSTYDTPLSSQPGQLPPRVYVGYSVYKGKAALTAEPRPPEFSPLGQSGAFKLSKEGFVLLQFAPATGVRQYDWGRKQVFSLSVTEIGNIISLGARDSCEFFHDPNKGRSDEGKVRKVLKVEPLPDGSGHFFNLSVQNKLANLDESIYIPITKAEFAVLVSSFNFIIPYLLGWHTFANTMKPEDANRVNSANPRSSVDFEWNR
ncbi:hypothetical protein DH2020_003391 [Rehmannia glutinosa]|uniref:Single-stranded DNA-binding protein WHY1, chloroplastic n=1 Tax=Rehmannia glutinosa TaxID=99300 RepID=A0ABR0XLN2_REHGL